MSAPGRGGGRRTSGPPERSAPSPRVQLSSPAVILAAGAVLLAISLGIRHTFGLFLAPMTRDNGWTREVFALAMAAGALNGGGPAPLGGGWWR